jgi:hemerythrin-like metal-binding domain
MQCWKKKGKEVLGKILDELAAYTVYHFSTEEKYMEQCGYPGLAFHKKEHDTFVGKVESLIQDYQANKLGITIELMTFLKDWVSNHIQITDKNILILSIKRNYIIFLLSFLRSFVSSLSIQGQSATDE